MYVAFLRRYWRWPRYPTAPRATPPCASAHKSNFTALLDSLVALSQVAECAVDVADDADDAAVALAAAVFADQGEDDLVAFDDFADWYTAVWKSKFYGAFVLNHRVVLHAIDATPAR